MLIQGANNPLTIKFSESVENLPTLVVTLWTGNRNAQLVKMWEKPDMMISGDTAVCDLTEEETRNLSNSTHVIEAKGLDGNGFTVFWAAYDVDVLNRRDKVIVLTEEG